MYSIVRTGLALALLVQGCATVTQLGSAEIGNTGRYITAVQVKTTGIKGPDVTTVYTVECTSQELDECHGIGQNSGANAGVVNALVSGAVTATGIVGAALLLRGNKASATVVGGVGGTGGTGGAGAKGGGK